MADEAVRLCSACCTPREKRIVWVLLDTGLRLAELAALSKGDIDLRRSCLYAGTLPDRRAIPLSARIEPLLASWFEEHDSLGLSARSIQRIIKDVGARAGLKGVGAEVLRHTFAVTKANAETPPVGVAAFAWIQEPLRD
jgi:integrase